MTSGRALGCIAAGVLAGASNWAGADPLDAANYSRQHGCGGSGIRTGFQASAKLAQAAKRISSGASLQDALAAVGYAAVQSSAMHLSGRVGDKDIARALAANYCRTLLDPQLRDIGAERRGGEIWMIIAAPAPLPTARDSVAVAMHILLIVNQARSAGRQCGGRYFAPVRPLLLDAALTTAAREHSLDMAAHDEFDHRGHDGSTPAARIERGGFTEHRIVGENIAAGAMTAAEVAQGWLDSPAHCENIMDGRFTHVGIGYAENLHTASAVFWTQDFAAHR